MDLGVAMRRFVLFCFINPVVDIAEGTGWSNWTHRECVNP